jgi:hypothetical protein
MVVPVLVARERGILDMDVYNRASSELIVKGEQVA